MKFKEHYNDGYVEEFGKSIKNSVNYFNEELFINGLKGKLEDKELFQRLDLITDVFINAIGDNYDNNITYLFDVLGAELKDSTGMYNIGWRLWPLSCYIERLGNKNFMLSFDFIRELTKRFTGEFAVRPLLKENAYDGMRVLLTWTNDKNVHVRRAASEGVRIRLPWAKRLYAALEEFDVYKRILTNLSDDGERFVQKSVANNLNDLFKEAPEKAYEILNEWKELPPSKAREFIIKHGTRGLRK